MKIEKYKLFIKDIYRQNFDVYELLISKLDEKEESELIKVIDQAITHFNNKEKHPGLQNSLFQYMINNFYFNPGVERLNTYRELAQIYKKSVKEIMDMKEEAVHIFKSRYAKEITDKLNYLRKKKSKGIRLFNTKEGRVLELQAENF